MHNTGAYCLSMKRTFFRLHKINCPIWLSARFFSVVEVFFSMEVTFTLHYSNFRLHIAYMANIGKSMKLELEYSNTLDDLGGGLLDACL